MKVALTTLTGNNEDIIGEALSSVVGRVDICLVIDTGVTDHSLEIARSITLYSHWVLVFSMRVSSFSLRLAKGLSGDLYDFHTMAESVNEGCSAC